MGTFGLIKPEGIRYIPSYHNLTFGNKDYKYVLWSQIEQELQDAGYKIT